MTADSWREIERVRDAERFQFLVQPIVAAQPRAIGVAGEPDGWGPVRRMDMQDRAILSAVLATGVHLVETRAASVELVMIDRPGQACSNAKTIGVLER